MLKALIVCQAGDGIGLGHLSRSLVIAKALKEQFSIITHFIIQSNPFEHTDLSIFSHEFLSITTSLIDKLMALNHHDFVILDLQSQRIPVDLEAVLIKLRAKNMKIIAIDGLLAFRKNLDLIFLPAFHFTKPDNLPSGAPIVYGWDCFLLNNDLKKREWTLGNDVLALTGGSDVTHLGDTWPELLNEALPENTRLHWVTGPFAKRPVLPKQTKITFIEHIAPSGLADLYQIANYAITVYGVSFFELLYVGIPTVVFSPYGNKDMNDLQIIDDSKIAMVAKNEIGVINKLQVLMTDEKYAKSLAKHALMKLRYNGSKRFCDEISLLFEK